MKLPEFISFANLFDFALIGLLLYRVGLMIKGTRAMSIFLGIIILGTTYTITRVLGLKYTHHILSYFLIT